MGETAQHNRESASATRRCPACGAIYPRDFVACPKDGSVLPREGEEGDPLIGEVLAGAYCVTRLLGSGGMGRVYEAEHLRLPRRFAVKVMHESLATHPQATARFEREAQAVARIASEHVLDVVDVVRTREGYPCLVSELLEGEELGDVLDRAGKLPLATALTIARQVCRGLAAAHAVGVIHRDLKPSNLFLVRRVDDVTQVKVLDFGVAKLTDGASLTRTGVIVGTPAYMSPEQARGSAGVDARADVYATGAVLYRMLTGWAPFPENEDPARTVARLLGEDPRRPRDFDRTIPEEVELVIQRAMARSVADRPESALAFDQELARVEGGGAPKSGGRAIVPAHPLGAKDTHGVADAEHDAAHAAVKRARRARPAAFGLALGVGAVVGSAVFISTAAILALVARRSSLTDEEKLLIGVLAAICTIAAAFASLRVLVSRWRSALAIERLGSGLRTAVVTLLASSGALSFAYRGYGVLGPPLPKNWFPFIDLGLVVGPTVVSALVLVLALRRAGSRP